MAAVISEGLEEGQQLFIAQKQGLNVRKKHFLPQTLPEEGRCWQVCQAEEGTKSHLLPKGLSFLCPQAAFGPWLCVPGNLVSMLEGACELKSHKIRWK